MVVIDNEETRKRVRVMGEVATFAVPYSQADYLRDVEVLTHRQTERLVSMFGVPRGLLGYPIVATGVSAGGPALDAPRWWYEAAEQPSIVRAPLWQIWR